MQCSIRPSWRRKYFRQNEWCHCPTLLRLPAARLSPAGHYNVSAQGETDRLITTFRCCAKYEPESDGRDERVVGERTSEEEELSFGRSSWHTHWQVPEQRLSLRRRGPATALLRRRAPSASSRSASDRWPLRTVALATNFSTVSQMTSPITSLASICSSCRSTIRNVISWGVSITCVVNKHARVHGSICNAAYSTNLYRSLTISEANSHIQGGQKQKVAIPNYHWIVLKPVSEARFFINFEYK